MKVVLNLIFLLCLSEVYGINPQVLWEYDLGDSSFGQSSMADIDGDGKQELVFGCYMNDSCIYALNAEDGSLLWKYKTVNQLGCNDAAPLIYDVDNDGLQDVVVASSCDLHTYCFDGKTGAVKWAVESRGTDSPPSAADIDGDGFIEILHGDFGGYVVCLNGLNGEKEWEIKVEEDASIQSAPTISDLDGDGILDFVVSTWNFNTNSAVYAYSGKDRALLWTTDVADVVYHSACITNMDNNEVNEIVLGDYDGNLWAFSQFDGSLVNHKKFNSYIPSPVVSANLPDGGCGIIFTSGSKIVAAKSSFDILWEYEIPESGQSFRGAALSDLDSDGFFDAVFGTTNGYLIALSGIDGTELFSMNLSEIFNTELDINHAPIIGDFNSDGLADVFIVGGITEYPDFSSNYGKAIAINLDVPLTTEWKAFQNNHHRTCSTCDHTVSVNRRAEPGGLSVNYNFNRVVLKGLDMSNDLIVYDLNGRIIMREKLNSNQRDILKSNLSNGIYFVQNGVNHAYFIAF